MYTCVAVASVRVGFESMKYVVAEEEGSVEVCLNTSSAFTDSPTFLIYTEQRSAQGMYTVWLSDAAAIAVLLYRRTYC